MSEAASVPFSETKAPEAPERPHRGALRLIDISASTIANIGPAYSFYFGFGFLVLTGLLLTYWGKTHALTDVRADLARGSLVDLRRLRGPSDLAGRRVFVLHPHQTRYVVPARAAYVLPDAVPAERAVLAANLETAVNALWDARPHVAHLGSEPRIRQVEPIGRRAHRQPQQEALGRRAARARDESRISHATCIVRQQRILTDPLRKDALGQAGDEHDGECPAANLMGRSDEHAAVPPWRWIPVERQQTRLQKIADLLQRDRPDRRHRSKIGEHAQHPGGAAESGVANVL